MLISCLNVREGSLFTCDNCLKRIVFVRYSYLIVKHVNYSQEFFFEMYTENIREKTCYEKYYFLLLSIAHLCGVGNVSDFIFFC